MNKKLRKRCMAGLLALSMMIPMASGLTVYAEDRVVDTFYVLDEEGNPVTIEITQSDLDNFEREETRYGIMTVDEEPDGSSNGETAIDEPVHEEVIGIVRFNRDVTTFNYTDMATGRTGYLSPMTTADAAYLGTQEDGILCFVSGVKMLVAKEDVAEIISYQDQDFSKYYVGTSYLIHSYAYYSGSDTPTVSTTRVGLAPDYLKSGESGETKYYYSYDGHYFYETFESMIEDYKNDVRDNSVNPTKPYYNYYQYLSFHTKAGYTAEQYDDYVVSKKGADSGSVMLNTGKDFTAVQNTYTINGMLMFGIAINESGWGLSKLAKEKNNLFGLNAVDSNPTESGSSFSSTQACIEDFAYGWLHSGYMVGSDSRYRGPHLGDKQSGVNVKYASDPYWGEKAASRPYYFDEKNTDYGRYSLGIAKKGSLNLYKEADTSSKVIYSSETKNGGDVFGYPITIIDKVTGSDGTAYYQVVSDMSLLEDRSARDVAAIFKPSRDYVYAKASDIQFVFEGSGKDTEIGNSNTGNEEEVILPFTDVAETGWYIDSVKYVYKNNLMKGKTDTTFAPDELLTRAQYATILYRVNGEDSVTYENVFKDVPDGIWYSDAVMWAYQNEIVKGYENGLFGTEENITREQLAVMMYRYAKHMGYSISQNADLSVYTDENKISGFAKEGLSWAVGSGIMQGKTSTVLDPSGNATRAEAATIIMRFCEKYAD